MESAPGVVFFPSLVKGLLFSDKGRDQEAPVHEQATSVCLAGQGPYCVKIILVFQLVS